MIDSCLARGLVLREVPPRRGPLSGKTLVFTGTLGSESRPNARALVERLGGSTSETVSRSVHYVVVGRDPGAKYEQARERGIPVLSETQFLRVIQGGKASRRGSSSPGGARVVSGARNRS